MSDSPKNSCSIHQWTGNLMDSICPWCKVGELENLIRLKTKECQVLQTQLSKWEYTAKTEGLKGCMGYTSHLGDSTIKNKDKIPDSWKEEDEFSSMLIPTDFEGEEFEDENLDCEEPRN
jgi:hypothetical protein